MRLRSRKALDSGCRIQVTSYQLPVAGYRLGFSVVPSRLHDTGCELTHPTFFFVYFVFQTSVFLCGYLQLNYLRRRRSKFLLPVASCRLPVGVFGCTVRVARYRLQVTAAPSSSCTLCFKLRHFFVVTYS